MIYLLIYTFSLSFNWVYFRQEYKKNRYSPDYLEVFMVLCPGINTIIAIGKISEISWVLIKKLLNRIDVKKFFKL